MILLLVQTFVVTEYELFAGANLRFHTDSAFKLVINDIIEHLKGPRW